jgi:hypothetical protein
MSSVKLAKSSTDKCSSNLLLHIHPHADACDRHTARELMAERDEDVSTAL